MPLEPPAPQALVIFGASGDLARKKLFPALYELACQKLLPERHVIIGFALSDWNDDAFRDHVAASIQEFGSPEREHLDAFLQACTFVPGSFDDPAALARLGDALEAADRDNETDGRRLFYLAIPPPLFLAVVKGIGEIGQNTPQSKIVIEKPFGDSLGSSRALTQTVHDVFDESQVFRIDHYLGKETVQNIVVLRFANSLFERVWNRDAIDHIQLTVAEAIGVEGRAAYYEKAGAIRDLLQNHMLQVLAFLTMEPPRSLEPEAFRDERGKLLQAVRPIEPAQAIRGQYEGYTDEPEVAPDSTTETYVAARVWIDNWRWDGVPMYLRHGKRLPERNTEITVVFRDAPDYLFRELGIPPLPADHLTIRVQPDEGIALAFQAKVPGSGIQTQTVRMDFDYDRSFTTEPADAYVRLIHDAMDGDHTLFTREDSVERSWELVAPLLASPGPLCRYAAGSWGPVEADELIAPRHWHRGGTA